MSSDKEEKKEIFEPPKAVDLGGRELTVERLEDEELEDVAGGGCNGGNDGCKNGGGCSHGEGCESGGAVAIELE